MDALLSLRQSIRAQQPITYFDDSLQITPSLKASTYISFSPDPSASPEPKFSKTTATRFQRPTATRRDWNAHPEDFYALQAVLLAWISRQSTSGDYIKLSRDEGVGFLSVTDREPLVAWLDGRSETLDRLIPLAGEDSTTPPGSPSATNALSLPTAYSSTSGAQSGSASGQAAQSSSSHIPHEKRAYQPDLKDLQAVKKIRQGEIEIRSRTTALRGTGAKLGNFTNVRELIGERIKQAGPSSSKDAAKGAAPGSKSDPKAALKKKGNVAPIIMISSSPTALITMYNVRRFLEDSVYENPEDAKRRLAAEGNVKLDDVLPIYRRKTLSLGAGGASAGGAKEAGAPGANERPIKYFVVDGVEALGKFGTDAWDRVICVMTTGQAWQFKPYKWQDPNQLFHHVKGIHVAWANDPPNLKVKDWNVTDLKIDPIRRHVDKMTVANFWMQIDDWVLANKPWLPT